ncbi:MAG: hypothetical protein ABID45_03065 [Patescibacteria group bacterium]
MRKEKNYLKYINLSILFLSFLFFNGCVQESTDLNTTENNIDTSVPLAQEQDLGPEALAWDGKNFWTTHEPGWEMEDEVKPGHPDFQAYLFKHAKDSKKTAVEMYAFPHNYNVIGMVWINDELWTSTWIHEQLGRIYKYRIENNSLAEIEQYDTQLSCDGLTWDGNYLWCNMGSWAGIWKFDISDGLKEIHVYSIPPEIEFLKGDGAHPKGIAWDGNNIWTAYKFTKPVIVKHNMDEELSLAEEYDYQDELLNHYPGGIDFANGVLYSTSSDPGTLDLRGGRIVEHNMDENLSINEIYFYNDWK